ncbi:hypothetical protein Hanom_Chr10g00960411 [Helianthus anomalus]
MFVQRLSFGTKSQVEQGAKRPCVEEEEKATKPNHTGNPRLTY